jgi:maleate isomerase
MYGWRGRFAHLSPSRGDILVHEFYRIAPRGVMLINSTGTVRQLRDDDLEARLTSVEAAARDVAAEAVELIVVGGSPLVTMQGYGSERRLSARLSEVAGVTCITGLELEMEALRAVGCQRPVIATPYPPTLDERLVAYLRAAGFDVQGCVGLGLVNNSEIGALPEHASLRAARRAAASAPAADGVFLPCARWPTLDAVPLLEQELGLPVVSSTLSVFYGAFERLGIRDGYSGFGSLLERLTPRQVGLGGPARLEGVQHVDHRQADQRQHGQDQRAKLPQLQAYPG